LFHEHEHEHGGSIRTDYGLAEWADSALGGPETVVAARRTGCAAIHQTVNSKNFLAR